MRRLPTNPLALLLSIWALVGCSSSEAPNSALSLAPLYHLKTVDGVLLPIPIGNGSLDSGHVRRLGGDTVRIDEYSHFPPSGPNDPGTGIINLGTWAATQFGSTVVLRPILATSLDTAFVGAGEILTLHTREAGALHVNVYVTP